MTLLEFARGPALQWSAVIFTVGMLWRIIALAFFTNNNPLSANRRENLATGGMKAVMHRFTVAEPFKRRVGFQYYAGWVWHIGFVVVLFFFEVHVMFFKSILGFEWPALPNFVIVLVAAMSAGILLILLIRRIFHPVLRYISTFNDYSSVVVTLLPFLTGLATYTHFGIRYETLLALHFLSIALLLVWFPFSKLFHALTLLPSRYVLGVKLWRRGVDA
jgi:nitrate reductase gamma subunit